MGKPKIRFKGYEEDWEQRKFGDFTWDAGKRNKENLDLVPYAITNEHGFISQSEAHDEFGYMKDTDRRAYNIVEPNSFAYNPARINVGSLGYYEGTENVIVSSLYEVFKTAEYVDDRFLWHWLKSPELTKWIGKLQEGSVRLYFYYDKLCECVLQMPSIEEQRKISKYLDSLEHLITLHQRKYEETKKLKKYMLQKMFPQNEKKVPEIRFSRYTEDWEQRKLGDIADVTKLAGFEFTEHVTYSDEGTIIALRGLNVKNGALVLDDVKYIDGSNFSKLNRSKLYINDVLFTYVGTVGELAIIPENDRFYLAPNVSRIRFESAYNAPFMIQQMGSKAFYSHMIFPLIATSSQPALSMENIRKFIVSVPKEKAEQDKIGEYFSNLDHLITLHQHKCEELRKIKKYMLQNMFV